MTQPAAPATATRLSAGCVRWLRAPKVGAVGLALSGLLAGAAAEAVPPTSALSYTVRLDEGLGLATVTLCDTKQLQGRIVVEEAYCAPYASAAQVQLQSGAVSQVAAAGGAFVMPADAGLCLSYQVDVASAARKEADGRTAQRTGSSIVVSPDLLLWHPSRLDERREIRVSFELAPGHAVSAPWPQAPDGAFEVPASTFRRQTRLGIGAVALSEVKVPGGLLKVGVLDGYGGLDTQKVDAWLAEAGRVASLATGSFPRGRAQVLVMPVRTAFGPVPFGKSVRGGGPAIHLFVGVNASLSALNSDWVAVHEMSHLLHPFINFDDAWLSEGLATWYQEVLRARGGHQTPAQAWSQLDEGFARGRRQSTDGKPLAEVSAHVHQTGQYMRVYWSGAAFALLADLQLRELSAGRWSLDRVLGALGERYGDDKQMLRSWQVADAMDVVTGQAGAMRALHDKIARGVAFPDLSDAYKALGLVSGAGGLAFDNSAPSADYRRALMSTPQGPAPSISPH